MTRRVLSISLLVALSWGTNGIAQERANVSGTWVADRQRSESFKQAAAAAAQSPVRLIIRQSPNGLSIERQRDDGGTDTISYSFDSAASTARAAANESTAPPAQSQGTAGKVADADGPAVSASGTSVTNARAEWKDGRLMLLTVWSVNGRTVDTREALTLSQDGRELTVQTELKMQHGYESDHPDAKSASDAKDVFIKAGN